MLVAQHLQQPTRTLNGSGRSATVSSRSNRQTSCLVLLPVGFTEPSRSPGPLVRSYRTVSPLPPGKAKIRLSRSAVYSLWHFPYPHGRWALPTTAPCGARTFLSLADSVKNALHSAATTLPTPVESIIRESRRFSSLRFKSWVFPGNFSHPIPVESKPRGVLEIAGWRWGKSRLRVVPLCRRRNGSRRFREPTPSDGKYLPLANFPRRPRADPLDARPRQSRLIPVGKAHRAASGPLCETYPTIPPCKNYPRRLG